MRTPQLARFHFGNFVADLLLGELYESGNRISIQEKALQFLHVLLEKRGEVVTREELSKRLWPDTHVQVSQGLNAAARKVRLALHDDAANPRYVETLGSRGYRFIAPFTESRASADDPRQTKIVPHAEIEYPDSAPAHEGSVEYPSGALDTSNSSRVMLVPAYERYLRGRHFCNQRTPNAFKKGLEHFNAALLVNPNYALAHAGIADTYNLMATHGQILPKAGYESAREAAAKALQLEPDLPEALVPMGWAKLALDYDRVSARTYTERAIELNPNYAFAYNGYSILLMASGEVDKSIEAIMRGRELDPLSLILNALLSNSYYYARDYDRALRQAEWTVELDPRFPVAQACLGLARLSMGRTEDALKAFEAATLLSGESPIMVAHLAYGLAVAGNRKRASELVAALGKAGPDGIAQAYHIGLIHIALGDYVQGLNWIQRACDERFHWTLFMDLDPALDPVRGDRRFKTICKSLRPKTAAGWELRD